MGQLIDSSEANLLNLQLVQFLGAGHSCTVWTVGGVPYWPAIVLVPLDTQGEGPRHACCSLARVRQRPRRLLRN
jgi:hypothetical protein